MKATASRWQQSLSPVLAMAIVATACTGSTGEPLVLTEDLGARLQASLDTSVQDDGLPGAQAAVVFPDGTVWTGASGDANRVAGQAVTAETRFAIASITKMFTATTILRLAERGELSLEDTVVAWLPDKEIDSSVTIRQLLSHTSGLPGNGPSTCEPGKCVNYSNDGYRLLGRVIEAVTGDTLATAYHTEIIDDLALTSTALATQEAVDGPQAIGHDPEGALEPAAVTVGTRQARGELNVGSSGAIVSTASDVAVFAAALFRGELLGPQMMREMLDVEAFSDLPGADPCRAFGLGVLRESVNVEFGLAWGHNGITNGFTAAVKYYPGYDIATAVLVNASRIGEGAPATVEQLAETLLDGQPPINADRSRGRCEYDVYTIRPAGNELTNITTDARLEWSVTWSPDGRQLMFATALDEHDDLHVIGPDGSGLRQVTDTPGVDGAASWSPDGTRIVFESERSGERSLYTADADGSRVEPLAHGRMPSWSPDGATIAYSKPEPNSDMDLWLIDHNGTNPHPLVTETGDDLWPSWSPDSSAIALTVNGNLAIVDITTGTITPIEIALDGIADSQIEFAAWGPTGHIALIAGSDIWTVRPDGTDPYKVGGSPGRDFLPAWSPDGELIAFIGSRWHQ